MTPAAILKSLAAQGVTVRVVGQDLVLRPKGVISPQLKAELKMHKAEVRALLDPDVRWRVDILQPQIPPFPAPIPHLAARPGAEPDSAACFCCGDCLVRVPDTGVGQCNACRQAISLLIAETRREYERSTLESQGRAIAGMVVPEADRPKESSAPLEATCRWCDGPITDRRRTWFCSDDCRKQEGRVHRITRASRAVSLAPAKARPGDTEPGTSS